jgi:hypothetical protein
LPSRAKEGFINGAVRTQRDQIESEPDDESGAADSADEDQPRGAKLGRKDEKEWDMTNSLKLQKRKAKQPSVVEDFVGR